MITLNTKQSAQSKKLANSMRFRFQTKGEYDRYIGEVKQKALNLRISGFSHDVARDSFERENYLHDHSLKCLHDNDRKSEKRTFTEGFCLFDELTCR